MEAALLPLLRRNVWKRVSKPVTGPWSKQKIVCTDDSIVLFLRLQARRRPMWMYSNKQSVCKCVLYFQFEQLCYGEFSGIPAWKVSSSGSNRNQDKALFYLTHLVVLHWQCMNLNSFFQWPIRRNQVRPSEVTFSWSSLWTGSSGPWCLLIFWQC